MVCEHKVALMPLGIHPVDIFPESLVSYFRKSEQGDEMIVTTVWDEGVDDDGDGKVEPATHQRGSAVCDLRFDEPKIEAFLV